MKITHTKNITKSYSLLITQGNLTKSMNNMTNQLIKLLEKTFVNNGSFRYQIVAELINKTYLFDGSYISQNIYTSSRIIYVNLLSFRINTIINDLRCNDYDKCTILKSIMLKIWK